MRTRTALLALFLVLACKKAPPPAPARASASAVEQPTPVNSVRGKVIEKIDAAQYSYLKLESSAGEVWTAVPKTDKRVGEVVAVEGPIWMENFKSGTLERTWPKIAFGTLQGEAPAATPGAGQGPQVALSAPAALPAGHPPPSAPADLGEFKVAKAQGAQGRTIADVWAQRAKLKDRAVSVRGRVVKATNGVMGKNWLHLRDGTGEGPTADLTVASDQSAAVGDTVVVSGTVHLDRDLGAGYHYDLIVEDAQVKGE